MDYLLFKRKKGYFIGIELFREMVILLFFGKIVLVCGSLCIIIRSSKFGVSFNIYIIKCLIFFLFFRI